MDAEVLDVQTSDDAQCATRNVCLHPPYSAWHQGELETQFDAFGAMSEDEQGVVEEVVVEENYGI